MSTTRAPRAVWRLRTRPAEWRPLTPSLSLPPTPHSEQVEGKCHRCHLSAWPLGRRSADGRPHEALGPPGSGGAARAPPPRAGSSLPPRAGASCFSKVTSPSCGHMRAPACTHDPLRAWPQSTVPHPPAGRGRPGPPTRPDRRGQHHRCPLLRLPEASRGPGHAGRGVALLTCPSPFCVPLQSSTRRKVTGVCALPLPRPGAPRAPPSSLLICTRHHR